MLCKVLTSPKLLSTNNYLHFPDEECENAAKTELMAPNDLYRIKSNNSNNLFLHMNISSFFFDIDDLRTYIMICQNKLKVIAISECGIKAGMPSL